MKRPVICAFVMIILSIARDLSAETDMITEATKSLNDGVPEVAIVRLRELIAKKPSTEEWRAAAQKLAEALIAAGRSAEALSQLDDPRLRDAPGTKFWRAQALGSLGRWSEALPFFEQVAGDPAAPFRSAATFGSAEALRALGRGEEARQKLTAITRDKEWEKRAQFRLVELYLDADDAPSARRILTNLQPSSTVE